MAATVPQRYTDLVKKYGWEIIPRLASLGIEYLAEAQVLFVDSGATNTLDADDGVHGHSFVDPLATIDYAIGLCTASERSVILVAPGHNENYDDTTTGFDADVAGVAILGLGSGSLRPTLDFDDATSKCIIGANNVVLKNFIFRPSITSVAIGLELETGVTGCTLEDIEFVEGEDGSGADECIKYIVLTSGNHDTVMRNVKIYVHASATEATHGIHVVAASNRLTFDNVIIDGPCATGGIVEAAAGTGHIVENCSVDVSGTNYSFHGSSTFAKYTRNVDAGVDSEESEPMLEVARGTGNYPTGITDNSILAYMLGKGATASASTFNNTTDSLEAIADAIAAYTDNVSAAVDEPPTAKSLHDILHKDESYTFDNTSDSLEAIADSLITAIGSPAAGSALDILKKLYYGADGTGAYPATVANDSTLAKIMAKGSTATASTFDNTTDSLEAIADAVAAITNSVTAAVSEPPTTNSLQDTLHKDGTYDFDNTTDSLEALSDKAGGFSGDGGAAQDDSVKASLDLAHTDLDAILADTITISGATLPVAPTANSLARFIASGGTALGQQLPDSMSLVDLIGDYTGAHDGAAQDDNIKASLDLAHTDLDTIIADCQKIDEAVVSATPTANSLATFLVTGGTARGTQLPASTSLYDVVKYLYQVADGSGVYPASMANDSALAMIMCKGATATPSTYNNTTDSLEAIADALSAGTGCTTALEADHLDHLVAAADGTGAYPASLANDSILAMIMCKGATATPSTFDNTTDSLEAISDALSAVATDATYIADASLPAAPTANSIAAYIASGGTALGTELADSKSIVDAVGHTGSAFLTDGVGHWLEKTVAKTSATADSDDLFTVANGAILIKSLIGVVTTQIGATQTRLKVVVDSTSTNDDRDFSTQVDLATDAVGTIYVFSAANPAVLTPLTTGANGGGNPQDPWYCPAGVIETVNADDAETGAITWYLTYIPLATTVTVTAA